MKRKNFIGRFNFFARARARIYRSLPTGRQARYLVLVICSVCFTLPSLAVEPQIILGSDSQIHGVLLDHSQEPATRNTMQVTTSCGQIKTKPSAMALVGSEGAWVDPRIQSTRGMIILEGLKDGAEPKILHTVFRSPYQNYPTAISGERGMRPGPRYVLAITLAAKLVGQGDLVLQHGDYLIVHADGQLFAYQLPEVTIPSEGLLRLYLGTDDQLYYDAGLQHPFHSGTCGGVHGR